MFNNTKPNVILITDYTEVVSLNKLFGVHKIAYVLRQAGFEVAVINHASVFSIAEIEHLLSQLVTDQTLFVGINSFMYSDTDNCVIKDDGGVELYEAALGSFLPHDKKYNKQIKNLVNKINPRCKFVAGGPNVFDCDNFKDFDYLVLGYSELSVVNLANHLLNGETLKKSIRSIYGPTVINDPKAEGYDFSQCSMSYEEHDAVLDGETLSLEVGRGCVFNCLFCAYPMNGKKKLDYIRHKHLILNELLDNYKKFNITRYTIVDDTFNDSVEKCQMIYEISKLLPFKLQYWAYIRLDLLAAHPETIELLVDSGCCAMFFGIETFNSKTASAIRKGGNREKMIATIDYIKDRWGNQISLLGSFILGLPYEDVDSMQQTVDYLLSDKNRLDTFQINALRLRQTNYVTGLTNGFLSDLDRNYEKYGYKSLGAWEEAATSQQNFRKSSIVMKWQNEFTNSNEMQALANYAKTHGHSKKAIHNSCIFGIIGLGIDPDTVLTTRGSEIDWQFVDTKKMHRAIEYKKLLFDKLCIADKDKYFSLWDQDLTTYKTFSSFLIARKPNILN
jgi:radical SAM superfamily enzyme YgiQ (UPF0313 family)